MYKVSLLNFVNLFRVSLIGLVLVLFHLLAPQSFAAQPVTGSWALVGLSNYQINAVAVDPTSTNTIYAAYLGSDSSAGILKSIDGGSTWNPVNNGLPQLPYFLNITTIAIDPSNPNILYVGSRGARDGNAQYITGIFKSTDSGASWNKLTGDIAAQTIIDLTIDPTNTSTLYAAAGFNCNGVWKSIDSGATWVKYQPPYCDYNRVVLDPTNTNIVYAAATAGSGATVVKSVDGGVTWNAGNPSALSAVDGLAIDPFHPTTLYASSFASAGTGVYKTTDGGANWTLLPNSPEVGLPLITDPTRPNTVYAGFECISCGNSFVWSSSDGGTSWNKLASGWPSNSGIPTSALLVPANDPNVLYAATTQGLYVYGLQNPNAAPIVQMPGNSTVNQGATYSANGSFTDPDSTSWTATVDYGDGSGAQLLTLSGTNFSLSHVYTTVGTYTVTVSVTDNQGATGTGTATVTVQRQLVSLSPAEVWVGLKNSDDVGVKFDLLAQAYRDTTLVSSGELDSVAAGSSGFNNAKLDTIPFNTFSSVDFPSGSQLKIEVYVRNACTGSGHNSGTARLWYNDSSANSQFGATIGSNTNNYFLLDNFLLGTSAGTTKKTIDVAAGAKCSAFKPFGTWSITP